MKTKICQVLSKHYFNADTAEEMIRKGKYPPFITDCAEDLLRLISEPEKATRSAFINKTAMADN